MKHKIAFALIMGTITSCMVSLTVVIVSKGFSDGFARVWLKSWLVSFLVVIPSIILFGPRVQRLVDQLFELNKEKH